MDVRYQVFVSSTYEDLQKERQEVMNALLELDCIPAGMELFPAANEDQWSLIKQVIDDCDYYLVIIGGRYGSIGSGGISYTEMEYRYALEHNKPIIAFLHKEPTSLPAKNTESGPKRRKQLEKFRESTQKKMCKFWETPAELGSVVSRSLVKLIKNNPATGWVKASLIPDEDTNKEILQLRKKIEEMELKLQEVRTTPPEGTEIFAQGEDEYTIKFYFRNWDFGKWHNFHHTISSSWDEIFYVVSPLMINECTDKSFRNRLDQFVFENSIDNLRKKKDLKGKKLEYFVIEDDDFQTIKIQLRALGLIKKSDKQRSVKDMSTYWTLTPFGDNHMTKLRAIKKSE
ncbi:MAG: DUF4062 domain-containing protein [Nitrosopumilus sp.]